MKTMIIGFVMMAFAQSTLAYMPAALNCTGLGGRVTVYASENKLVGILLIEGSGARRELTIDNVVPTTLEVSKITSFTYHGSELGQGYSHDVNVDKDCKKNAQNFGE
jgi:hypothetical protein